MKRWAQIPGDVEHIRTYLYLASTGLRKSTAVVPESSARSMACGGWWRPAGPDWRKLSMAVSVDLNDYVVLQLQLMTIWIWYELHLHHAKTQSELHCNRFVRCLSNITTAVAATIQIGLQFVSAAFLYVPTYFRVYDAGRLSPFYCDLHLFNLSSSQ